ncbi:MAG: hypothetical protein HC803_07765 [Saprospiraceae bacterium]|nr:hypothetical protein [Saprospiraceae bacterium]
MNVNQQYFSELINNLNTVTEEEKKILLSAFKKMEKEAARNDFMLMRLQKTRKLQQTF